MRLAGCMAAVLVTGCYSPSARPGAPCDLALDNCPSGQTCTDTGAGTFCVAATVTPGIDAPGTTDDARPDNAPTCYGTGTVHDLCGLTPTNDLAITADRTINTAMVGTPNCDMIVAQPLGGPSLCLVTARSLTIASGVKVSASGANALVLIGTASVSIDGTLDAASHAGGSIGPAAPMTCGTTNAGGMGGGPDAAGGGGAGGSFGTAGAKGGTGNKSSTNNPGGAGGNPLATVNPTNLVGGCPGGTGGPGHGGNGQGAGGNGGGAVYVISGDTLTINGTINASGAGGDGGLDGLDSSGGGGGGGAGGMIGLDAGTIVVGGSVFSNGGGGGGGGGTDVQYHGQPGKDPTNASTAASGGNGGQGGGGKGGNGYTAASAPTTGSNGNGAYCGAGGGGGGAGIIRVFGALTSGGTFSPPPS